MIFNSEIRLDQERAKERLQWLFEKKAMFELTEKKKRRTINQNRYLHLILSWFGVEFGYTLEEVKQEIFKKHVNTEIFYQGEKGKLVKIQEWRSTRDLDTGELTTAIDRFRDFSAKNGCYLPEPGDLVLIQQLENELGKHRQYL